MSCDVTEPNRRPSSPACWEMVSTVRGSIAAFSFARSIASACGLLGGSMRTWAASTAPLVAGCASLRGMRKLRR